MSTRSLAATDALCDAWNRGDWNSVAPALRAAVLEQLTYRRDLDDDTREDIAAITVMRAWESEAAPADPIAWALRVAQNLERDQRKLALGRARLSPFVGVRLYEPDTMPVLDAMIREEAFALLARAFARLPESAQRALLVEAGATTNTQRMQRTRARRSLQRSYAHVARMRARMVA